MKIDASNGRLTFESGWIGPDLNRMEFLETDAGRISEFCGSNDGWVRLRFRPEDGVGAVAYFKDNRLKHIDLAFSLAADNSGEWSKEREQQRQEMHDDWLRLELGAPPYRFSWGTIMSDIDVKTGDSSIFVSYA